MALSFKFRDFFRPRIDILKEVGIKSGDHVLDYGCGPGSYIIDTARLVGESGIVYALDVNPLAIQMVQNLTSKMKLMNVKTIHSDCKTGLPDKNLDVVLLYDKCSVVKFLAILLYSPQFLKSTLIGVPFGSLRACLK
jgi:ubiquinone/menaquinone biosynthesis C-methylase UbiE